MKLLTLAFTFILTKYSKEREELLNFKDILKQNVLIEIQTAGSLGKRVNFI